jgi:hypothetical protein
LVSSIIIIQSEQTLYQSSLFITLYFIKMSFVKIQVSRFLNWVVEKNEVDSLESAVARFDELYELFAMEYNVAGSVIDSLVQIAVEKPKKARKSKNNSSISELTMSDDGEIMISDTVDGVTTEKEVKPKKPRAPRKPKVAAETPSSETPVAEQVVAEPNSSETPVSEQPIVSEQKPKKPRAPRKPKVVSEPIVSEPIVSEPIVSEPIVSEPIVPEQKPKKARAPKKPKVDAPVPDSVVEQSTIPENTEDVATEPKKKRNYNKKPKAVDTESNVIVVSPELVEEPMTVAEEEPNENDAVELEEMTIDGETFYLDTTNNLYNMEFVLVGKLDGDNVVML